MARATWFCIDIEASGPAPALYDMISLGCTVVYDSAQGVLSLGPSLYLELRPDGPRVDPGAMRVNGLDIASLRREGLPRREALERITAFVRSNTQEGCKAVFVGHNAPFDWAFVSWCYVAEDLDNPFGYKAFDTKAFSAGVLGVHWLDTSKEVLAERLSLPPEDRTLNHRADYDAEYQARLLVALLERQRRGSI